MGRDSQRRRSIRLRGYDYGQAGAHFVTICARRRACVFGKVVGGEVIHSAVGRVVAEEWLRTTDVRTGVELDAFVVMPNHLHGIVLLAAANPVPADASDAVGASRWVARPPIPDAPRSTPKGPTAGSLSAIVGQFKAAVTRRAAALPEPPSVPVWQRNSYEHVIRDEASLDRLRAYIEANPSRWGEDQLHPDQPSGW